MIHDLCWEGRTKREFNKTSVSLDKYTPFYWWELLHQWQWSVACSCPSVHGQWDPLQQEYRTSPVRKKGNDNYEKTFPPSDSFPCLLPFYSTCYSLFLYLSLCLVSFFPPLPPFFLPSMLYNHSLIHVCIHAFFPLPPTIYPSIHPSFLSLLFLSYFLALSPPSVSS